MTATTLSAAPRSGAALPTGASRDDRLDLLRGLFVVHMIVVHLGWRVMAPRFPIGFVTAAEGFFFVSGATLGLVAARMAATGRGEPFRRRLALRGIWLYLLNLALVVTAYALAAAPPFTARAIERAWGDAPAWQRLLTFDQPLALNVLPRYAIFLALSPLALALVARRRGPLWLAGGALALWAANWGLDAALRLPYLETRRVEFAAASWQLLFFGGMALATAWPPRVERDADDGPRSRGRTALLVASLLASIAFLLAERWTPGTANSTTGALAEWVERRTLGPLRMVNFVAAATLLWLAVDRWRAPIERRLGWLLLPLGRNALPAFVLHLPLLWIGTSIAQPQGAWWIRRLAALAAALAISQIVRWPRLRKWMLPV